MSNETTLEVTVTACKRLMNSENGNPRYELTTDGGTWRTGTDIGDAYKFSADSIVGKRVRVALDGRGSIRGIDVWEGARRGEWY